MLACSVPWDIQPGEKVPLKLTATERKLVLEELMCLDEDYEQIIRDTPTGKPVMMMFVETVEVDGQLVARFERMEEEG